QRKPEASDQRPIAAAKSQARYADNAGRTRDHRPAERIGDGCDVGRPSAARYGYRAAIGTDDDVSHLGEIDDHSIAQRAAGSIVTAAADRQREIAVACRANGALN